jgi:dUTPase
LADERIYVNGGIIDPDYTGSIKVLLENRGAKPYTINKGTAIAQAIAQEARFPNLKCLEAKPVNLKLLYIWHRI